MKHLLFVILLASACGGQPPTQTTWGCWNQGSAQRQALGADPHAFDPREQNAHYCDDSDFEAAGWTRDSSSPGGWRAPAHAEAVHPPTQVMCMAGCQRAPAPTPSCRFRPCSQVANGLP